MTEEVDVLVVGAGLSGVGAARHLQLGAPGLTYTVIEARGALGGTWDLFRYPGVRSDSDMFTLGYAFRPWTGEASIADGASIRRYIADTAGEYGIDRQIRYHHRLVSAAWSTPEARWTARVERTDPDAGTTDTVEIACRFLYLCTGYYRYDEGHRPSWEGVEDYEGRIVHPQHWPEDLDTTGARVVVVGSGATAVTLVPALAATAGHVTMLQRTPSYIVSLPARDPFARTLRRRLPAKAAYRIVRGKNVLFTQASYQLSRRAPALMKRLVRRGLVRHLPPDLDLATHFTPPYDPWDQRLCVVPDGDLFRALGEGKASVVTDRIVRFTPKGILLASGEELAADVVVTATGLEMLAFGGATFDVDGEPVDVSRTVAYKGMMFSGVPNLALALGYTNASWSLKCDLISAYVCRLLTFMDERGYRSVTPNRPPADQPLRPFVDLRSGYVRRAEAMLPKQGSSYPWRVHQNYFRDRRLFSRAPLADAGVTFR
ncbi:MAG TPA: NAD(P)/FAD-dependent oxidoreductase [Kineosporiaceae bacterium]|nr:NAD(P)/FAD-dependent oxidoreductase [Kineosporiaceae bacterium]